MLFNPVIPIYFARDAWVELDIFAIMLFGFHRMVFRTHCKKTKNQDSQH